MIVHACNPSTLEAEAGESQAPDQLRLHDKILSQKREKKEHRKEVLHPTRICM
jgi:hypothetical protein